MAIQRKLAEGNPAVVQYRVDLGVKRRASEMGFTLLPTTELQVVGTGTTITAIELPPST